MSKPTKIKATQILAVHKTRKDADGEPLYGIFPKLNFEKNYGKYGWQATTVDAKPPVPKDDEQGKQATTVDAKAKTAKKTSK